MSPAGLGTMLGVLWHTQRRGVLVWVAALVGTMVATAAAVAGLYDTPAKIHAYAAAVSTGRALVAINGRVEGIDSLGGVIQDEFGFMAAFLVPLLGISLVARATRREEESGRLETVLAGRLARQTPTVAALALAAAAITLTSLAFAAGLVCSGVALSGAALYAASLGGIALVFAGLAAVLAQLTLYSRGVYTGGLIALAVAYGFRGVGDVTRTWVVWLSPLGWAERAAPFGAQRWWTLLIPVLVGVLLAWTAVRLAARRDLGSAVVRGGVGPAHVAVRRRGAVALAARTHRPAVLGWLAGSLLLAAMMGALAQQFLDAILGNPAMAEALGATTTRPVDGLVAITELYLAVIASGFVVQAVGTLRIEESAGRLETQLAGTLSRGHWLVAHVSVVLGGLIVIVTAASVVFAATTAWSTADASRSAQIVEAGLAYLPAELVVAGFALVMFGSYPRLFPAAWAAFAGVGLIALLGSALRMTDWVLDLAPTTHIGMPPEGAVHILAMVVLLGLAVALAAIGLVAFRSRGIPQG